MKRKFLLYLLCFLNLVFVESNAQNFRYAFVSDTHVGSPSGEADLRRTVADINQTPHIDFVILTGDITEMGTNDELALAKSILDGLNKKYYIIPGNHDTGWSESGGVSFIKTFGYDKFFFDYKGYRFIGCASGPYVRMSDGHIPRDATVWLDSLLKATPKQMPLVFANHYPLDNSLDNWYEATDRLKTRNIQYAICGHGHQNKAFNFEGIPATMGRSNLRAKDSVGGYNVVSMYADSVVFATKKPGIEGTHTWRKIALKNFVDNNKSYPRPDYQINEQYKNVKKQWVYHAKANVVNTPSYAQNIVVFGNSLGTIEALNLKNGKQLWSYPTGGAIYSSAAIAGDWVIIGSGDGKLYALALKTGQLRWVYQAEKSILASPIIDGQTIYIGANDHTFNAIDLNTGKLKWQNQSIEGSIVGRPLLYQGKIIFGTWGRQLYALDQKNGKTLWQWNNGSANRMFSPAMVSPVASKGVVYIAAPDRYLTAIDANNGETIWRSNVAKVRESIGLSTDSSLVYAKTMQDEIVAFKTERTFNGLAWSQMVGFGYEHTPSDLVEQNGLVYFGTKNGIVYCIDPKQKNTRWAHKTDNSMVNGFRLVASNKLLLSTMDGVISLLKIK